MPKAEQLAEEITSLRKFDEPPPPPDDSRLWLLIHYQGGTEVVELTPDEGAVRPIRQGITRNEGLPDHGDLTAGHSIQYGVSARCVM